MSNPIADQLCNCTEELVHTDDCPVTTEENRTLISAWYAEKREGCGRYGHMERQSNEWGMGGGKVDFFCPNCQSPIESIHPSSLTREERDHIFGIAVEMPL